MSWNWRLPERVAWVIKHCNELTVRTRYGSMLDLDLWPRPRMCWLRGASQELCHIRSYWAMSMILLFHCRWLCLGTIHENHYMKMNDTRKLQDCTDTEMYLVTVHIGGPQLKNYFLIHWSMYYKKTMEADILKVQCTHPKGTGPETMYSFKVIIPLPRSWLGVLEVAHGRQMQMKGGVDAPLWWAIRQPFSWYISTFYDGCSQPCKFSQPVHDAPHYIEGERVGAVKHGVSQATIDNLDQNNNNNNKKKLSSWLWSCHLIPLD